MDTGGFQKILLAVDGSPSARVASHRAAALARFCGASVLLFHCRRSVPEYLGEPYYHRLLDRLAAQVEELLAPYRLLLEESGVPFEERVLEGDPARHACEVARLEGCDLIVLGTRGLSDLEGLFLGSVAHKVLVAAPCPVLAVR
ncbi:MAG: universal stress protein [Deferrisomatales bacterium]|nr:universal stress protein [Deferrisomatales bacterium]